MVFTMECGNRGCGEMQAPYLDLKSNKVYCSQCHQEMENITPFTKNTMRMNKQVRVKEKKSFSIKCSYCEFEDRPKIINDQIICVACNAVQDKLTPHFSSMLKEKLKDL